MKANELMIGDYIMLYKDIYIIEEISSKGWAHIIYNDGSECRVALSSDYILDNITPIPLTAEILEKNDFTRGEYKSYTGDVWYLKEKGFRKIGLTMSGKESTLWGEKIKPLYPDSIGHKFSVPNIKYVHELQHALRLCEISKNIEI